MHLKGLCINHFFGSLLGRAIQPESVFAAGDQLLISKRKGPPKPGEAFDSHLLFGSPYVRQIAVG
jgi:hypothetical protein